MDFYFRMPDGALSARHTDGHSGEVMLPGGATALTRKEYERALNELNAANAEQINQQMEAERAQLRTDYEALLAAGIPEGTARRITGYPPQRARPPRENVPPIEGCAMAQPLRADSQFGVRGPFISVSWRRGL
ncbi:hypothetical protein [Streptomyces chrestomyceticus]|uniref:Uncharacterized protein n=1 Tax=Streptomyces chrestomyceticus TaxID=68185 RepID=A0ABU7X6V9_9ACTN